MEIIRKNPHFDKQLDEKISNEKSEHAACCISESKDDPSCAKTNLCDPKSPNVMAKSFLHAEYVAVVSRWVVGGADESGMRQLCACG